MRVTSNAMMNGLMHHVSKNMAEFHKVNEMIATEKRINRLSDDPAGLASAIRHRGNASTYDQYSLNIRDAEEHLRMTDMALSKLQVIIDRAREIAETSSTETSSIIEKEIAANQIQELINEAIGIANTKNRDTYVFSGTQGEFPAYSLYGRVLTPQASTLNHYNDLVTAGGEYHGTAEFIVKFVQGGPVGDPALDTTAMYQISSDGGQTWSDAKRFTSLAMQITDSDGNPTGLTMTFSPGDLGEGDEFRLQVVSGKYMGDDGRIEFNNNMFSRVHTNVNGHDLFEDSRFFDIMYKLKNALNSENNLEVQESLEELGKLQSNIQHLVTSTGQALNRLEITKLNLTMLKENVFESIQSIEKADIIEILARFAMTENALNASVAALSKVFPASLMNYL
jgi:flagellin-like hook-associated protein FlgL